VARAWGAELDEAIAHKGFAFQAVAADYELVNNLNLSEFFSHTPVES